MKKFIPILLLSLTFNCLFSQTTTFKFPANAAISSTLIEKMQNNTNELFRVINNAYLQNDTALSINNSIATQSAIEVIQSLWKEKNFYCDRSVVPVSRVIEQQYKSYNQNNTYYFVRNILVYFKGDDYKNIIIAYDNTGKIRDLYKVSGKHDYSGTFAEGNEVSDFRHRQMVTDFVEMYRNYYNRKDIANIEKVFSNDALIITGTVIKSNGSKEMQPSNNRIVYKQQGKQEYIKSLRNIFAINKNVNIKFSDVNVLQHEVNPNVYGVRLWQGWNTSAYSDLGWLFLIIDFTDEDNPQIWVRTWQPDITPKNEVFGLDDFPIK